MQAADCPGFPKLDPRARRTRALLEDAMRALLAERPYDEISVGDIAARATVNRATFYAHFEDKRDLAAALLRDDLHNALLASLPDRASVDPENLRRVATAVFEFMGGTLRACPKHRSEFAPTVGPTLQETIQNFLSHWLEMDPDATRFWPGASRETLATVLGWSLYGAAYRWSGQVRRPPAERAAGEVVALLVR